MNQGDNMFWDAAAGFYDIFENIYNGKVNKAFCNEIAEMMKATDEVLECACGTGMITRAVSPKIKSIIATDFSSGMLKKAKSKCKNFSNVEIKFGNIMQLEYKDNSFDKVIAGNVIHLLDEPMTALNELYRVCKKGGQIIIPTYVNNENKGKPSVFIRMLEKFGAKFKQQFSFEDYKEFMNKSGYKNIQFSIVKGKMPCAIAVITKEN